MARLPFLAFTLSTLTFACTAPPDEASALRDDALLDAPEDTSHPWDVGVCQGPLVTDPAAGPVGTCRRGAGRCSGTLIAPNLVLTARHCVRGGDIDPVPNPGPCDAHWLDTPAFAGPTRITPSASGYVGTPKWYDVAEILVPTNVRYCEADVALLVLDQLVPKTEARFVGVDLARDLADHPPRELAIVARGGVRQTYELDANGDWTGNTTIENGDLRRRIAEDVPFHCASNRSGGCTVVDHEVPTVHRLALPKEQFSFAGVVISGDSGSAVFDQRGFSFLGGRWIKAIGVTTWNYIGPDGGISAGGGQRLDHLADFVLAGAAKAQARGGYRPVWWTRTPGPVDR